MEEITQFELAKGPQIVSLLQTTDVHENRNRTGLSSVATNNGNNNVPLTSTLYFISIYSVNSCPFMTQPYRKSRCLCVFLGLLYVEACAFISP